ncbi:hypothetical protein AMK16_33145 [Streptomyces sp. CB00455]|uniref:hypothetical protein n=1 Tax=Streptomyces sp. CB00455 TaxID=1703927 RepID=UPI0009611241|nr:hypothetical protein [Streptomyces sp. CB00455]OKK10606.1 hypothetical protein AMK16_33145 [Streptomyces sp. CB00455]
MVVEEEGRWNLVLPLPKVTLCSDSKPLRRRRDAVLARRAERARAQQEEYPEQLRRAAAQKRAEHEAARPVCAGCGTKFDNDRWENTRLSPEPGPRWDPNPRRD